MEDGGPTIRELKRQVDRLEDQVQEIEDALRGSSRWERTGLVTEVKALREEQHGIRRLVEAVQRENAEVERRRKEEAAAAEERHREEEKARQKRDDRNSRYLQLILGGFVTVIAGLALQFVASLGGGA